MVSIERTASPRFKRNPPARELEARYPQSDDEMHFARIAARVPFTEQRKRSTNPILT